MSRKTGLVLQGGGALGAFEYGVLRRLYEEPGFAPDVISGVSIGAINAACLAGARGDPIKTLGELWDALSLAPWPLMPPTLERFAALFGNPAFYTMRMDYAAFPFWTSFYNTDALRPLLERCIDFEKLNSPSNPITLLLSATNVHTGEIRTFDNRRDGITPDHILASGSLPPGFPMTRVLGVDYWDGGLFNNTPLLPAIENLEEGPDVKLYVVNLFPNEGSIPKNMMQVFGRMFAIQFSNKLVMDVKTAQKVNTFARMVDFIAESLTPDARQKLAQDPGLADVRAMYAQWKHYKIIQNIVVIANDMPEPVFGPFDFSRISIQQRIQAGYETALRQLGRPDKPVAGPSDEPSVSVAEPEDASGDGSRARPIVM
jgi:predicted acylesterase/phospholipase RssA